ncbi:MFS transporter [Micromonospora siamensis]|uniref:Transmembrane secretion effector n=1 Tax=Micromonospora siamensis TaxID=299152 RepID=A0A1C5HZQ7_9ACTN|nr:MFS transporter [Micromonospora siamensis]SCG51490.1 Transmembrane secretion effector [Micromonospora siamensis]
MVTRSGLLARNRDFRWFWAGHTVSAVGSQVTAVALPLVASLTLDAGAAGVAAVATAGYLPNLLLPLLVGHWLERRRRRRIMVLADLVRAAALAVVPAAYLGGLLSVPLLVSVALAVGAAGVVFDIGSFAYLPSLVEPGDLAAANRAAQGSSTAAQVAGPGIAGGLAQLAGPPLAIALDAASYLASAVGVHRARRPEPAPPREEEGTGILGGLRVIAANPWLRAMTAHATVYNGAAQILTVNLVVWAVTDRQLGAGLFGLAISAAGAGAFLGTVTSLRAADRLGYGRAFAAALVLSTGTPLLIAVLPGSGMALATGLAVVQFVSGIGLGAANVLSVTLRQIVIPTGSLARSNGGYRLLIFGVLPIGAAAGGALGSTLGSRGAVAVGAAGLAVSALPMFTRRIRTLRRPEDARPATGTAPPSPRPARADARTAPGR